MYTPVLRSGKSGSYLESAVGAGCCGILYGCDDGVTPEVIDSPDELLTTPLRDTEKTSLKLHNIRMKRRRRRAIVLLYII